jgi:CRP-like cAMP-binding protein
MGSHEPTNYVEFNGRLISALAPYEAVRVFERGSVVFSEGEEPKGIYVLLSGEIDLLFSARGEKTPLHFAVPGQILGLSSIVSGRKHEYTATAASTLLLGFIEREVFYRVLHETPERWFDVLQVLSNDIASCYDRVKQLAAGGFAGQGPVRRRT